MTKIKCKKLVATKLSAAKLITATKFTSTAQPTPQHLTNPITKTPAPPATPEQLNKQQNSENLHKKHSNFDRNSNTSSPTSSGVPTPEKIDQNHTNDQQTQSLLFDQSLMNQRQLQKTTDLSYSNLEHTQNASLFDTSPSQKFSDNEEEESLLQEELEEKRRSIEREKKLVLAQIGKMKREQIKGKQILESQILQKQLIENKLNTLDRLALSDNDFDELNNLEKEAYANELNQHAHALSNLENFMERLDFVDLSAKMDRMEEKKTWIQEKLQNLEKLKNLGQLPEEDQAKIEEILDFGGNFEGSFNEKFEQNLSETNKRNAVVKLEVARLVEGDLASYDEHEDCHKKLLELEEVKEYLSNTKQIVSDLGRQNSSGSFSELESFETQVSIGDVRARSKKSRKYLVTKQQAEKLAKAKANCDDVTRRMEELARENDILTDKLEIEAQRGERLKAKLKIKCRKLEKQKAHHLRHGKSACKCTFHKESKNSDLDSFSNNRQFNVITNEGNEYQNLDWSIMHQSSTIQLMLKRLGLGFMDSRYVTLVLPCVTGKTLDNLMRWLHLRKQDMEDAAAEKRLEHCEVGDQLDRENNDIQCVQNEDFTRLSEQARLDKTCMTPSESVEFDDVDEEDDELSIEYIRNLPEREFVEFINAAKYLNIHDLRDFCTEFDEERTWSNATPTSGETEQNELQNLCGKTFSVTSEKVEFLEETDFQVDEDIYC